MLLVVSEIPCPCLFMKLLKEEFEDTKEVIRIRISKKNRQHIGQKKKDKQRSTKHTHKTKDLVTQTPLKTGGEHDEKGKQLLPH